MADRIGARCCVNVVGTPYGPRWDVVNMITSPERYFFNDRFLSAEDPAMPMIIEHLTSDEEYIESVEYVKKRLAHNYY